MIKIECDFCHDFISGKKGDFRITRKVRDQIYAMCSECWNIALDLDVMIRVRLCDLDKKYTYYALRMPYQEPKAYARLDYKKIKLNELVEYFDNDSLSTLILTRTSWHGFCDHEAIASDTYEPKLFNSADCVDNVEEQKKLQKEWVDRKIELIHERFPKIKELVSLVAESEALRYGSWKSPKLGGYRSKLYENEKKEIDKIYDNNKYGYKPIPFSDEDAIHNNPPEEIIERVKKLRIE